MIDLGKVLSPDSLPLYNNLTSSVAAAKSNPLIRHVLRHKLECEKTRAELELDLFLTSPTYQRKYNMDDRDKAGWIIYHRLTDKFSMAESGIKQLSKVA